MVGSNRSYRSYRGTLFIRNTPLLGTYSRTMPRALWWSLGGGAISYERGTPVPVHTLADHGSTTSGAYDQEAGVDVLGSGLRV